MNDPAAQRPGAVAEPEAGEEPGVAWGRCLGEVRPEGASPLPPRRLARLREAVERATGRLRERPAAGAAGRVAEWLLDNAWLVQRTIDLVAESLPRGFCRRLPAVVTQDTQDARDAAARVECLAWEIVYAGESWVEPQVVQQWVEGFQRLEPLTIGELWALPAMLRWALVEDLTASAAVAAELPQLAPARAARRLRPPDPARVAACIQSLRALERHDWKSFLESTSTVEATLRRDPCGAYAQTAFATRDRLRKAVEELARRSPATEAEVAAAAVRLSAEAPRHGEERRRHVGFWLVDAGRTTLEREIGFRPPLALRARRWLRPGKTALYLVSLAASTLLIAAALAAPAFAGGAWMGVAAFFLCLIPASTLAVAGVHWAVTQLTQPRVLPKLELEGAPPPEAATTIIVPAMLADPEEVASVLARAEKNWLGNADAVLGVAFLLDYPDAPEPRTPDDAPALQRAVAGVEALNRRYGAASGSEPFLLLVRDREWSESEQQWMGWERKRGKLEDFNRLILGEPSRLRLAAGETSVPRRTRFVITLDADTILPPGAARRLIGTLAHPLNRPVFDARGRVVAGYTVLQPRVDVAPWSVQATTFSRVFSGERGLDLYSRAVSDVYQDLFGEGAYVGKGIYDAAAFHRSLADRLPEGAVLSHDLLEGLHGRAGLVSDVALIEEFPGHPLAWVRRQHRWIRGDWQIAPWLLAGLTAAGRRSAHLLSLLDRWKIADNLRRSLVMPALLALLVAGWLVLPGPAWWWTAVGVLVPGIAFVLGTLSAAQARLHLARSLGTPREWVLARVELARWGLALALLPYEAQLHADAVVRALTRMLVTRRHLLEWTPAYRTEKSVRTARTWRDMAVGPLLGAALGVALAVLAPARLPAAGLLLLAWIVSPALVDRVARPLVRRPAVFAPAERRRLRRLARRTWSFFERTLGPADNWLPPDHVQEAPRSAVARRTSPTNIGLAAASALAAWDLGYLSLSRVAAIVDNLFDTLGRLERARGHFLNWYDTQRLTPLAPRYVSTVDSGNLACALVALARGLEASCEEPLPRPEVESEGLVDALETLLETVTARGWEELDPAPLGQAIAAAVADLREAADAGSAHPGRRWRGALERVVERHLPAIEARAAEIAEQAVGNVDPRGLADLRERLRELRHQAATLREQAATLLPWLDLPPGEAGAELPDRVPLDQIAATCAALRRRPGVAAALAGRLDAAAARAEALADEIGAVVRRADELTAAMDFTFLYDAKRHLFRIGYDVDSGRFDSSWYDLFASEARAASFFAIATGAVPVAHWLHLGRPFTRAHGQAVLLSWSGTLFEYLMPALFLRTPSGSLSDFAAHNAIDRQIAFGHRHGIPWGVSESAFYELDAHGGYQYRAFGVADLALRRELGARLVVTPYASCLAAGARPGEVARNLEHLAELGAVGAYGLYEAVDFGRPEGGRTGQGRIVRSYMAHHQAMILLAFANALAGERMVERFLADPRMSAVAFLLYENTPERVPVQSSFPAPPRPRPRTLPPPDAGQWGWTTLADRPRVQVLSNGRWSTLISDRGAGGARWQGYALTRWRADPTVDRWGTWIYLQDLESGALWSATAHPTEPLPGGPGSRYEVLFTPHAVELRRAEAGVFSRLVVCVAAAVDVEVRQLQLRNDSDRRRRLGVTSFGEVALARHGDDRRHPAFSKLFVESRFDPVDRTLSFRRRGGPGPTGARLVHAVVLPKAGTLAGWETDRGRFVGRTGRLADPEGLRKGPAGLGRTQGATLDPAFALGCEVELGPGEEAVVTFLTAVGGSEAEAVAAIDQLRTRGQSEWAIAQARERAASQLAEVGLSGPGARHAQALLDVLVYPYHRRRREAPDDPTRPRQGELWALGISGDNPVLLLRVARPEDTAETLEALRAHAWLRSRQVRADLAVLDEGSGGYADPLRGWLQEAVGTTHGPEALGQPGGVYYVAGGRLDPAGRRALEGVAALVLDTGAGGLAAALAGVAEAAGRLPPFVPVPSSPLTDEPTPPLPPPSGLAFAHERGGLAADGKTYVIRLDPGRPTPAPWCGVVANPGFGFVVTERGGGFTWSENSSERRLSPWSNDPVLDPPGEVLYLRDEETGEVWSATPEPAGRDVPFEVRHGAGFAELVHHRHGLAQRLRLFVPPDAPVKVARLELTNLWQRPRRLTATFYVEWTLGVHRDLTAPHVVTEVVADPGVLLGQERFARDFPGRCAFLAASERLHGFTADRREFLGAGGPERPAGLGRIGLGGVTGAGLDPCGVLQVHVDLPPGESRTLHFLLGEGRDREEALALAGRWRDRDAVAAAAAAVDAAWEERLGRLEVATPEPAMDAMVNRWLPYQALACRLWARSGFYQSSGAFGFRDQLQDALAFLITEPALAREQILECARRQFPEGDVLHWWHPPGGAGARTHCSDDLVWLPYAIAAYVEATGDRSFLETEASFIQGPLLAPGEEQRYDHWPEGPSASLYEHGKRALERAWTAGPHGLPLIGGGDWNDGMDRVGADGRGESVWLGWFLLATARAWEPICEVVEGAPAVARLRERAAALRPALERVGWDGAWYRRAYYDDGTPLGTTAAAEARIDSISQSWAVLSGAADPERARRAVASARDLLVREDERLVLLLAPPFDRTDKDPGYIKAYPPGIRENGGQYTHAAAWLGCALAELGDGEGAEALFRLLNPLLRSRREIDRYRVEPYVVAGDVYGAPPHLGRGGWTWYTGSAGWLWRFGVEWILGLRRRNGELLVDPCIPPTWPGFTATLRLAGVEARIKVENPDGVARGIAEARLDGRTVERAAVPLDVPGPRELVVRLGAPGAS